MNVVCVDTAANYLKKMTQIAHESVPSADVHSFTVPKDALEYMKAYGCDVLLTEIELYDRGAPDFNGSYGIVLANEAKKVNPLVNTIFVTVCDESEFAKDVLGVRASGYITKPFADSKLAYELANLRNPICS